MQGMVKANLLVLERNLVIVEGVPIIRRGCTQYPQRVCLHRITR